MKISLLEDKISFRFEENISNGGFVEQTQSGILIQEEHSKQVEQPRWGIVHQIGPECVDVKEGDVVLIEAPMWTNGIDMNGTVEEFWVTREEYVMAIR